MPLHEVCLPRDLGARLMVGLHAHVLARSLQPSCSAEMRLKQHTTLMSWT